MPRPWVPTDLGAGFTLRWWGAAGGARDINGTVAADGARVRFWDEARSGGQTLEQTVAGARPLMAANVLNGYPVLRCDDAARGFTLPAVTYGSSVTILAVVRTIGSWVQYRRVMGRTNAPALQLGTGNPGSSNTYGLSATGFSYNGSIVGSALNSWGVLAGAVVGSSRLIQANGGASEDLVSGTPWTGGSQTIGLLNDEVRDAGATIETAEAIVLEGDVLANSRRELDRLVGYLSWKYGLQGLLPGGHAYAAGAPQVDEASRSSLSLGAGLALS
jgi:hypothetical protein